MYTSGMSAYTTKTATQIDNTCVVFVEYEQDDRGHFSLATLGNDNWGDRAVVVDTKPCGCDGDCRFVMVAPDENETLETIHVDADAKIAVESNA